MPNRRVTLILNSNQSKRITVVLPTPLTPASILQVGKNKFKDQTLRLVYLPDGQALNIGESLPDGIEEVRVSKGEPFIGKLPGSSKLDTKAVGSGEVKVLADRTPVNEEAIKQLETVAKLPHVYATIGLPDLHKGDQFPIGCSVLAHGIYPALIGTDIGCGVSLYPLGPYNATHLTPERLASRLVNKGLDSTWKGDHKKWLSYYGLEQEWTDGFGTVGGGNHFAEVVTVERIVDSEACESMGVTEGELYLMVHTGSRGLGYSILQQATKEDGHNPYYEPSTDPESKFRKYLKRHDYAVNWARANRDLVAHRIKSYLFDTKLDENGEESEAEEAPATPANPPVEASDLESNAEEGEEEQEEVEPVVEEILEDPRDKLEKILDVTHNSVVPTGYIINGESKEVWIHRKGAAPTDQGFVPCPGSRGAFSWIVQPIGDGQVNGHSLAHGAGRLHARNAAILTNVNPRSKSDLTVTSLDSKVICNDPQLLLEERPEAYKPIQSVIDDMESKGIAEGVAVLRPFVTYKVGDSLGAGGVGVGGREREKEKTLEKKARERVRDWVAGEDAD